MTSHFTRCDWTRVLSTFGLLAFVVFAFVSCASVPITGSFKGVVVDDVSGVPLRKVAIRVVVMRVSSYDGTTQFVKYDTTSNERGEFALAAHKKFVDTVGEKVEEVHYYETIAFGKEGYLKQEFRTDADNGPFSWSNTDRQKIVIRLKQLEPGSVK